VFSALGENGSDFLFLNSLGFFLPLGATAQGELWPPEQSASILLYSSSTGSSSLPCRIYFILEADYLVSQQFNFYGVMLASRPTPNLEDQGIPLYLAPTP
jgi:hypothetical protein